MRRFFKAIGTLVSLVLIAAIAFFGVATVTEYRPKATEDLAPRGTPVRAAPAPGQELTLLSFNIGYGGLGRDQDFFMDGGGMVRPDDKSDVEANLDGIVSFLKANPADAYLLQEVDSDSHRSFKID
ncbi:MAG: hypothetical protein LBE08_11335, partial [Bifidobacteriaceae bacterium]|nr:hypothetical protein [Bifidobacteriaceae bacterium]